jgi:adenylosuccinate lyase
MFALGEKIGKQKAHDSVYELSMKTVQEGKPFAEIIREDPEMKKIFSPDQLAQLLNPSAHTGSAGQVVEEVLSALKK